MSTLVVKRFWSIVGMTLGLSMGFVGCRESSSDSSEPYSKPLVQTQKWNTAHFQITASLPASWKSRASETPNSRIFFDPVQGAFGEYVWIFEAPRENFIAASREQQMLSTSFDEVQCLENKSSRVKSIYGFQMKDQDLWQQWTYIFHFGDWEVHCQIRAYEAHAENFRHFCSTLEVKEKKD